ncbi:MAG: UDP-galactopyranose mutase, partial [Alistipes sp.]|nr:UDP-galactopyranose mutase [Alistipes sp.]
YGAHIFHTNSKQVWDFVNSIVEFNRYTNCPVANYKGELYNLPFNMNTFNRMWGVKTPAEAEAKIAEQRAEAVAALAGREPANLEEQALTLVGRDIFEKLIKGYTEKQWGRSCKELPAFIIKRLPVRMVFDNNYFNDLYQGIPIGGYNKLIDGLLDGVEVRTGVDFFAEREQWEQMADKIVFTGKIDEYYGYCYGKLEYRTVRFEQETIDMPNYQGNAVVNYTEREVPYTRVIEHKHFESFGADVYANPKTIVSREYSTEWEDGMEPYYPVNDEKNSSLYAKYKTLADGQRNVIFGGRLAEYKYYDMAPIVEKVLQITKTI